MTKGMCVTASMSSSKFASTTMLVTTMLVTTNVGLEGRRDPTTCRAATARVGPAVAAGWPDEPPAVEWGPDARRSATVFAEPAASCERSTTGRWRHRVDRGHGREMPWAIRAAEPAARRDCVSEPDEWR